MTNKKPLGLQIKQLLVLFQNSVAEEAHKQGVSLTYFPIIRFLRVNAENNITQSDIANYLNFKAPSISKTLQNMEADGLLKRTKSEEDSRKTYVSLTDKGIEMDGKIRECYAQIEGLMRNAIGAEEIAHLEQYIRTLSEALEKRRDSDD